MIEYLQTERLILRYLVEEDAENLLALDSDPEVMRYIGPVNTDIRLPQQWLVERIIPYYTAHPGFGFFAAMEKTTGAFLGWFILRPGLDYRFAKEVEFTVDDLEIGYRLLRSAWGKGYGTEGADALMRHAFRVQNAPCVAAVALKTNIASWRVMEKIGMKRVGEYPLPGYDVPAVTYRLCQEQFRSSNP
jgi:RimJ/RimL family protein N-acetyltransferase